MIEATTDSYRTQAVQHAATAAYLAEKASSEEWKVFNQLCPLATEENAPSETPVNPEGGDAPAPQPADPPDNESLPGDPPETQPDY